MPILATRRCSSAAIHLSVQDNVIDAAHNHGCIGRGERDSIAEARL